jgi:pyruvate/2-oxoglutarate dehydrogenase complex dihydrolipoamide acyltransferase (E2) component
MRPVVFALLCSLCVSTAFAAKKSPIRKKIDKIQKLFYRSEYQEVLPLVHELRSSGKLNPKQQVEVIQYQAFVLYLLSLSAEAKAAWLDLLAIDPKYRLNPDDVSPEFITFFNAIELPSAEPAPAAPEPPAAAPESEPEASKPQAPEPEASKPTTAAAEEPATPAAGTKDGSGGEGETPAKDTDTEVLHASDGNTDTVAAAEPNAALSTDAPPEPVRGCGIFLCLVPFGVGQFANDQVVKGILFAGLEAAALAINLGMYWDRYGELTGNGGRFNDPSSADAKLTTQRVTFVSFFALMVIGVGDAFLFP